MAVETALPAGVPESAAPVAASAPLPAGAAKPRVFCRVPTHVVGVINDRREYPRAHLHLPMRLTQVAEAAEPTSVTLLTRDISATGIYFFAPRRIEPGTPIELEIGLVERPLGQGSVRMATAAHVVRVDPSADAPPGWHGVAATFDDFDFQRDETLPPRFRQG